MRRVALACLLASAAACGGSSTPPSPVLMGVAITAPPGILFLGQSYQFAMAATLSNGRVAATGGRWGSDAPGVATVDSTTGVVDVVGLGEATIFVDYEGQRATHRVRTTMRYEGRVAGISEVIRCVATGDHSKDAVCLQPPRAIKGPFWGTFTQNDRTVTARMLLSDPEPEEEHWDTETSSPVSTQINDAGELRFETRHRRASQTAVVQWTLRPAGVAQLRGTHVMRFRSTLQTGYLELTADIVPVAIDRPAPGLSATAAGVRHRTFFDLLKTAER